MSRGFSAAAALLVLEMSLYWEFPWVPWKSHGNGIRYANLTGKGMKTQMACRE